MLISHDLGTSGNKASLYRATGELVATASATYPTVHGRGTTEQDPHDWWRAVVDSTRQLLATAGAAPGEVSGICVAAQMMAAVLLDEQGEPVRRAMIWSDQRATEQSAAITRTVGTERSFTITGHRVAANYTLPKVAWVRDHEPELFARTRHVCVTKDYVNLRLTGRLATDHSDASSTAAYDLATGTWSTELLDAAGIDASLWPEVVASTDVLGTLTPAAAADLGLTTAVRVVAGGGDGPMANVAAASLSPEDAGYVCLGTSAWYATTTVAPIDDAQQRGFTYRHIVPGFYTPCATTQAGAASLAWFADALACGLRPADLAREASGVRAGEDGLFFLPHLLGERTPWWNPDSAGSFAGLRPTHGRAHLARAVMEGVGLALDLCRDALADGDHELRPVSVIGGGANSDEWLQLFADLWGVPVLRRGVTTEATALGAAVTGLVGLGEANFSLVRGLAPVTATFAPRHVMDRDLLRARHTSLYTALEGWFRDATGA